MRKPLTVERINMIWATVCTVLILALGGTTVILVRVESHHAEQRTAQRIQQAAVHTQHEVQASCQFWRTVGSAPLPAGINPLGLSIVAGVRIAYAGAECPGQLPPADPRVRKLLPPGVR